MAQAVPAADRHVRHQLTGPRIHAVRGKLAVLTVLVASFATALGCTWAGDGGVARQRPWLAAPDEAVYPIRRFEFEYGYGRMAGQPTPEQLLGSVRVTLRPDRLGYVAPREGLPSITKPLEEFVTGVTPVPWFSADALDALGEQTSQYMAEMGHENILVLPAADDIDPDTRADLRFRPGPDARRTALRLMIWSEGPRYPVTEFRLRYFLQHPKHPQLAGAMAMDIALGRVGDDYVAPRPGAEPVSLSLSDVQGPEPRMFRASAIRAISRQLVNYLNGVGLIGVVVAPDVDQIEEVAGDDQRVGDAGLDLVIRTGIVTKLRTIAHGERIPREEAVNSAAHALIRDRSPVQPADDGDVDRYDLLRKDVLDDYVFRLNRHPGRRVDVALGPAMGTGQATLDLLVTENKPWLMYFQLSNTGTEETNEWRERFGFIHNQVTGHDDILQLDYVTAGFDESHSATVSYERPFPGSETLRWRLWGSANEFTASDVGQFKDKFDGDSWLAGLDIVGNVFQSADLFVDLLVGARWEHVRVKSHTTGTEGEDDFFIVSIGPILERVRETSTLLGAAALEWNMAGIAGTDEDELDKLGRIDADDDWVVLRYDLRSSFYLEPLLNPGAWADPSTPESSTLAHELAFAVRGQHSFGDRLVPQAQAVAGGLYTVRGYEESVAVGDTAVVATAEYRYHVPRTFRLQEEPRVWFGRDFRYAPQQVYGRPDWDLIVRAFVDAGRTLQVHEMSFENDQTLLGAGVGLELQIKQNLSVRVDYGRALSPVRPEGGDAEVEAGDDRVHFALTLLY